MSYRDRQSADHRQSPSPSGSVSIALALALLTFGANGAAARHYQDSQAQDCAADRCSIEFGAVANGKRLHLNDISCTIKADGPIDLGYAQLMTDQGRFDVFTPLLISGEAEERVYAFNHRSGFVAEAEETISVGAGGDGANVTHLSCRIAGKLVKAN